MHQNVTSSFKLQAIFLSKNVKIALKVKGQGEISLLGLNLTTSNTYS